MIVAVLVILAFGFTAGLLAYGNPLPAFSKGYWIIARRRLDSVIAIAVVAVCQSMATIAFQTVANNRIVTPSIMGFEALYVAIQTTTIYFFGATGLLKAETLGAFLLQLVLMVALSVVLYSWLLTGPLADMHTMLLVGIVIGGGLASLSTFMQRMLTPSEFDLLTARLFGSISNADREFYPVAIPLAAACVIVLVLMSRKLNIVGLGRQVATGLGVHYSRLTISALVMVSMLVALSTALVGPMTFLGFLVATLAYQWADTFDHRYLFPLAALIGYVVLTGAYFILNHVFYAQGVVSIIIELVGGIMFLAVVVKKGRL